MNTRAYIYEGLDFSQNNSPPARKNRMWRPIQNMTERLGQRYVEAELARRDRALISQMGERQLSDVGLNLNNAQREIHQSFFDLGGVHR